MSIGVVLPRDLDSTEVLQFARRAEDRGFSSLWVIEDLGFRGGFAQAAAALAVTKSLHVGLGIAPAGARNPMFTAMEAATLGDLFPGRFRLGLGHGVPGWMTSVGAWPQSPLTSLEEHLIAVRALLHGKEVSFQGKYVRLDGVRLAMPPRLPPLVIAGVRGPKSLRLSGRVTDGTLLAEPVSTDYLRAARRETSEQVGHKFFGYALAAVHHDSRQAREAVRPGLVWVGTKDAIAHVAHSPYFEELKKLLADCSSPEEFTRRMPDEWVDDLTLSGTVDHVLRKIEGFKLAGMDEVILFPSGPDRLEALDSLASLVTT